MTPADREHAVKRICQELHGYAFDMEWDCNQDVIATARHAFDAGLAAGRAEERAVVDAYRQQATTMAEALVEFGRGDIVDAAIVGAGEK